MKIYTTIKHIPVTIAERSIQEAVLTVHIENEFGTSNIMIGNSEFDVEMYQMEDAIHELISELCMKAGLIYSKENGEFIINLHSAE